MCLRFADPLGLPVLALEEVRSPSRNKVLPDTANAVAIWLPLKVQAVGAPGKHCDGVTIS